MTRRMQRRRLLIRMRGIVLAALLLVPLLSVAHHHGTDAPSHGSCAMCVVAHHAPAVLAAPTAAVAPTVLQVAALMTPSATPAHRVHSPIAGRAPPSFSTLAIS
jgi:hypothetical protein